MDSLSVSEALAFVRARYDEIAFNNTDMISNPAMDDRNFEATLLKLLPEAITSVHLEAPSYLMEGESQDASHINITTYTGKNYVLVELNDPEDVDGNALPVLRLVSLKASDSDITVNTAIPEDSPEGRMQLNPYTQGTYDNPKLVALSASSRYNCRYMYYSKKTETASISFTISVFFEQQVPITQGGVSVFRVSSKLHEAVLNRLTAMMLETYGDQRAQTFYQKAAYYMK